MECNEETNGSQNVFLTIAIPTYQRPELLYSALESVVHQSYSNYYEIIVVDNCSEDEFRKKVDNIINYFSKFKKINLYRNESNVGMFGNWNECLKKAKGRYVTILNDDDLLDYKFVENAIKDIRNSKMIIYKYEILSEKNLNIKVGGNLRIFLEKFNLIKKRQICLSDILYRNPSNGSLGVVFDRKKAISLGGYEKKNYPSADYYFNYKYIKKFGGIFINKKLAKYRLLVNESLKKDSLKNFVVLDFNLREEICLNYFKKNHFLFPFIRFLNSIQGCSQIARYILIRDCKISDFKSLDIGFSEELRITLIKILTSSQYICVLCEILILFSWKIIFLLIK